jgi:transposase
LDPEQHLAGYAGLMQADAYAGFSGLYEAKVKVARSSRWRAERTAGGQARIDVLFVIERRVGSADLAGSPSP